LLAYLSAQRLSGLRIEKMCAPPSNNPYLIAASTQVCAASASGGSSADDELCAELEQSALAAEEAVDRFKEIAQQLQLAADHLSFQALDEAESVLVQLKIARRFASRLKEGLIPEAKRQEVIELIALGTRRIRRAGLRLQAQTFRLLDEAAEKLRPVTGTKGRDDTGRRSDR
jgi:hypothetical protein